MRIRIISLLLLTLSFTLANAQVTALTMIQGQMAAGSGFSMIYLDTLSQSGSEDFAAGEIKADGKFTITAPISKTDVYKLRLDDNNYLMLILSPGENVSMQIPGAKLGIDAKIKGSPQTEFLYRTINLLQPFEMRRDSLNTVYNDIQKSASRDSLSPLVIAQFMKNDSLQKSELMAAFAKQPGTLAWMFLQDKFDMAADFAFIDQMEKALYEKYPYIPFVKQYHQQIETERKTAVGSVAPDISLPDPEGNIRSLSSLRGKVVLIDFWASWCGPCRKENPNVVKAYAAYKDKGFEVFSVSLDKDREGWLKAIATDKLIWPNHVSDLKYWKSAGAAAYGVTAIPFTVLIDREGRIVAKKLRGEALEQKLKELLK